MIRGLVCLMVLMVAMLPSVAYAQHSDLKKIRINPEAALEGKLSQYAEEVQFIPLAAAACQLTYILQLEVTDNHYVVLSKECNAVLIFTRAGDFHAKIDVAKNVFRFRLTNNRQNIEVISYPDVYVYDFDGRLQLQSKLGDRPHGQFGAIRFALDDAHDVYYNTSLKTSKDSLVYQLLVYRDGKLAKSLLPYPENYRFEFIDQLGFNNFSRVYTEEDKGAYYIRNYDYQVYHLTPSSVKPVYQFIFPLTMSLPGNFATDTALNGRRTTFMRENMDRLIYRINVFYRKDNLLFFSVSNHSYLYDLESSRLVNASKLTADSLSWYLPISETGINSRNGSVYVGFDGTWCYFSCFATSFYDRMNVERNKAGKFPEALEKFFSNRRNIRDDAVILVRVKFKNRIL